MKTPPLPQESPIPNKEDAADGAAYDSLADFRRKLSITIIYVAVVGLLILLVTAAPSVIPLIFISMLIAVLLRGLANPLSRILPIPARWLVLLVALGLVTAITVLFIITGPSIAEQFDQLTERIPQAVDRLEQRIRQYQWGNTLLERVGNVSPIGSMDVFSRLTGIFSSAFGALTNVVLIIVAGVYLAFEPGLYVNNFVRLFPMQHRQRAEDVLNEGYHIVHRWLIARLISMVVVGILTYIGLLLIGMPLALTLAIIAGLLSFIPNIGPILSAVPGILVGLTQNLSLALLAVLVYVIVQQIENYLITPNIERETVALPPALVMLSQVFLILIFGWLGLFIAAPLVAFLIVLVKSVYIEDMLGDKAGRVVED